MQGELENVHIFGVNAAGEEAGNANMTEGRTLPLLQDDFETDAWGLWNVQWRDVVVLDGQGVVAAVYNLSTRDLADPMTYEELRGILSGVN